MGSIEDMFVRENFFMLCAQRTRISKVLELEGTISIDDEMI